MKTPGSDSNKRVMASRPATPEEYRFIVSGYAEAKDEILRLRNANRAIPQDIAYLDWRYQQLQGAPQPLVFWVVSEAGLRVGMASLIFRPYWIDGILKFLAVLGDISLDADFRGIGLGQRLLQFVTRYIDSNLSGTIAFVIPNAAAEKSLSAAGWKTAGKLIPHVFLLNPAMKLIPLLRLKCFASGIGRLFKCLASQFLSLRVQKGCTILIVDRLDESLDAFWRNVPKAHLILRDRGVDSLSWRFLNHPQHRIQIASAFRKTELLGYVAFEVSQNNREVMMYDLVVAKEDDIGCVVALFVLKCREFGDICTIRIITSDDHPAGNTLSRSGFVCRKSQSVFQIHSSSLATKVDSLWALTWGDKDI